jgi:hypothetical protein
VLATVGFGDINWKKTDSRSAVTYKWPDKTKPGGNPEHYGPFKIFEGEAVGVPYRLGLGKIEHGYVSFVVGPSGALLRPVTVFFRADGYAQSGELVGLVRGRDGGRAGWGAGEALPPEYDNARTEIMGDRIDGKFQRLAVVVTDDEKGKRQMLDHTAAQLRLRGLA